MSLSITATRQNMKLYLIRHAESTFNVWKATLPDDEKRKHPLPGHRDCAITELGKQQCALLRDRLSREGLTTFDAVVVSPLRRTRETLEGLKISSKNGSILTTPLCREYAIDECDFLEMEEIVLETKDQLFQRIEDFKRWVRTECAGCKDVAVITHSDFMHFACNPRNDDEEHNVLLPRVGNCEYIMMDL